MRQPGLVSQRGNKLEMAELTRQESCMIPAWIMSRYFKNFLQVRLSPSRWMKNNPLCSVYSVWGQLQGDQELPWLACLNVWETHDRVRNAQSQYLKAGTVCCVHGSKMRTGEYHVWTWVFEDVSRSSDYWLPNVRAELIKKYMQIAILAGTYFCTLQCGTICLPVSQVRRGIRGITRQTPWGRDALFVASLPIAVNSLALPKRHSCLLFHRQMALTKCLLQHLSPTGPSPVWPQIKQLWSL